MGRREEEEGRVVGKSVGERIRGRGGEGGGRKGRGVRGRPSRDNLPPLITCQRQHQTHLSTGGGARRRASEGEGNDRGGGRRVGES